MATRIVALASACLLLTSGTAAFAQAASSQAPAQQSQPQAAVASGAPTPLVMHVTPTDAHLEPGIGAQAMDGGAALATAYDADASGAGTMQAGGGTSISGPVTVAAQ